MDINVIHKGGMSYGEGPTWQFSDEMVDNTF